MANGIFDALMLCLARLIRCAIVASGTRNALAISTVVRPPTARSVNAIADGGVSAGWQHMKSSTSVSSSSSPISPKDIGTTVSIADISAAVAESTAVGVPTELVVAGEPRPVAPGIQLAAYRIVQEALTNARRHAPGAAVDVALRYEPTALRIRVSDDGPGPSPEPSAGHGLRGIEERVAMVGGMVRFGPGGAGGFVLEAELPIERPSVEAPA